MIDGISARVHDEVLRIIATKANLHPEEIDLECNIFDEGWVDSLGMFRVLLDLEESLNIKLPTSLITDERMHRVEGMMRGLTELVGRS